VLPYVCHIQSKASDKRRAHVSLYHLKAEPKCDESLGRVCEKCQGCCGNHRLPGDWSVSMRGEIVVSQASRRYENKFTLLGAAERKDFRAEAAQLQAKAQNFPPLRAITCPDTSHALRSHRMHLHSSMLLEARGNE
jgi:hypothetical protein